MLIQSENIVMGYAFQLWKGDPIADLMTAQTIYTGLSSRSRGVQDQVFFQLANLTIFNKIIHGAAMLFLFPDLMLRPNHRGSHEEDSLPNFC
jgi:hypothetical protein